MRPALPLLLGLAAGCTDSGLYSTERPPIEANRVTLSGRVCTDDPETARFPIRVVLVVDQAAGPLYSDFDPGAGRVTALSDFVQSALSRPEFSFAVVGYAGRAQRLAPEEGTFTRNPGELLNGLNRLSLAGPCLGESVLDESAERRRDVCRDYDDGLRVATTLIEDDLAARPKGVTVLTQYAVVLVNAGRHLPLATRHDCCAPGDAECLAAPDEHSFGCQASLDIARIRALRERVGEAGAAGLQVHVLHLAAEPEEADNDAIASGHQRLAFAGGGRYARFGAGTAIDVGVLRPFDRRVELRAKHLVVANATSLPGPDGPRADSDRDGIADALEAEFGTSPDAADSDEDGASDLVEVLVGRDPTGPDPSDACADIEPGDLDLDGLSDCDEALLGTDRSLVDSDGDGLADPLEVTLGTDYLNPDAVEDTDADGIENGDEITERTDPRSADLPSRLGDAYRYTVTDLGRVSEGRADRLRTLTGVEVVRVSEGSTPGRGLLRFAPGDPPGFAWKDPGDDAPGPVSYLEEGTRLDLPSSSWAPIQGDEGRLVTIEVVRDELPPTEAVEQLRIAFRERHCLRYLVRNVRLLETRSGVNDLFLYLAEAPDDRLRSPGPFRLAHIPVRYTPPDIRDPAGAILTVRDEEFVRPKVELAAPR